MGERVVTARLPCVGTLWGLRTRRLAPACGICDPDREGVQRHYECVVCGWMVPWCFGAADDYEPEEFLGGEDAGTCDACAARKEAGGGE